MRRLIGVLAMLSLAFAASALAQTAAKGDATKGKLVFEGTKQPGNLPSLKAMARASANPMVHFLRVSGADHFSILAPTTRLIAESVLRDDGPVTNLAFTEQELNLLFAR